MTRKKIIYMSVAALLLGGITAYLFRYIFAGNLFAEPSVSLNSDFREQVVAHFGRRDSIATFTPGFQHVSLKLSPGADEQDMAAMWKGIDADRDWLLTVATGAEGTLQKCAEGKYDEAFRALCKALPRGQGKVYLRWNPDMEVPVQLYAWQYQSPVDYIKAFRHVAGICRTGSPAVRILWGAAGYPGADEYWPGEHAVDAVGISVDGQSERTATAYPADADLNVALRRKIIRTRWADKPLMLLVAGGDSTVSAVKDNLNAVWNAIKMDSAIVFQSLPDPGSLAVRGKPLAGVYDPKHLLTASPAVDVEHLFVDLVNIQSGAFEKDFESILKRGHQPIITVEPWRDGKVRKDSSALRNTVNGTYDEEFREVFRLVAKTDLPVYVRFAHEMEIPIHRYSWQSQDPVLYIKAYRHFMGLGMQNKNVRKVWGPAGDRGSMEWYPGDDMVDFVSIAIYGLPDKNITDPEKQESFETIYNRKAWRMRLASKPIFITEFGVKGPEAFQRKWMENAAHVVAGHKEIAGTCYFNLADNPKVWGNIPAPDWGISRATFEHFIQTLNAGR
nr:hypothetical protein [uncultured Dyadobacter sp.]